LTPITSSQGNKRGGDQQLESSTGSLTAGVTGMLSGNAGTDPQRGKSESSSCWAA